MNNDEIKKLIHSNLDMQYEKLDRINSELKKLEEQGEKEMGKN
jgi:hypothetical protein